MDEEGNSGETVRAAELCAAVNDIMLLLNSSLDSREIMQRVLVAAANAIGSESARIALREKDHWLMKYVYKLPEELLEHEVSDEELPHAALAMVTRKPVAVDDAFNDHRCNVQFMRKYGIRSVLVLPLLDRQGVVGALFLNYHTAAVRFSKMEIDSAERIAAGTAVALQNARLYQDLKTLQGELEEEKRLSDALNRIDKSIYSTLDSNEIFRKVLQQAAAATGAESAMVFSRERDGWVVRHVYKLSLSLIGKAFSDEEVKHTAVTAVTKEPMAVTDALHDEHVNPDFAAMLQIRSLLDFPLIVKGDVIGDLVFHYHSGKAEFTKAHIGFVAKLQNSLSLALENARLFEALQKQSEAQKEIERQLQQASALSEASLAELDAIINSMNDGLTIINLAGEVVSMNPSSLRLHGLKDAEEARRHLSEYLEMFEISLPDGTPVAVEDLPATKAVKGEAFSNVELRVRRRDTGAEFIGSYSGAPVVNAAGEIISAVITVRDVTDVKQKEEELERSDKRIREIIERTTDGFASFDRNWCFTYINENGAKIFNRSREEIVRSLIFDILPAKEECLHKVAAGEVIHLEDYYPQPLNLWLEVHGYPAPEGATFFFRDITERKRNEEKMVELTNTLELRVAERTRELMTAMEDLYRESDERIRALEQLRDRERLLFQQSRLAAMGEMVGNIAHQWRQPLNNIGLMVQELNFLHQRGNLDREILESRVDKVMALVHHMSQTITDFRNFFKPNKEKVPFHLDEVVARSMQLAEPSLKEAAATVTTDLQGGIVTEGHPSECSQVILNIVNNACDAFIERAIAEPRIDVKLAKEGEVAVLTIADNGGGIPEEIIGRIFDPYFTTKGDEKGTGVGLYMSKMIIENSMQGRIEARNTAAGAEFVIEIPCTVTPLPRRED